MHILKSTGDGIGTAAGVAWPTFSIIFSSVGMSVGGITAIILGSILSGLFLVIALPLTYLSYKDYIEKKQRIQRELEELEDYVSNLLLNYLLAVVRNYLITNKVKCLNDIDLMTMVDELKSHISNDININRSIISIELLYTLQLLLNDKQCNKFLYQFASILNKNKTVSVGYTHAMDFNRIERMILKNGMKNIHNISRNHFNSINDPANYPSLKSSIFVFSAAFGSIAGCSMGTLNLLTCLGIFAGLSSIPVLGWLILAASIFFGSMVVAGYRHTLYKKNIMYHSLTHYDNLKRELTDMVDLKQSKTDIYMGIRNEYQEIINRNVIDYSDANNKSLNKRRKQSKSLNLNFSNTPHPIWRHKYHRKKDVSINTILHEHIFREPPKFR